MNTNLTPAALDLAAKFDALPPDLRGRMATIIDAAATIPAPQESGGDPEGTDAFPRNQDLDIPVMRLAIRRLEQLRGSIARIVEDDCSDEFKVEIIAGCIAECEGELQGMFNSHFRGNGPKETSDPLWGMMALGDWARSGEDEDPEDTLSRFLPVFYMMIPAMIQRCRDVIGMLEAQS